MGQAVNKKVKYDALVVLKTLGFSSSIKSSYRTKIMKKEIYTYSLPKELNILFIVGPAALLLFSIIFYLKQSYLASAIFFVGVIVFAACSTYKKIIYFDADLNSIFIHKTYLGTMVTASEMKITPESKLKLFTEKHKGRGSMGYTEISGFLTLALIGKTQKGLLEEQVLCSEHRDNEKKLFLEQAKNISEIINIQIIES